MGASGWGLLCESLSGADQGRPSALPLLAELCKSPEVVSFTLGAGPRLLPSPSGRLHSTARLTAEPPLGGATVPSCADEGGAATPATAGSS